MYFLQLASSLNNLPVQLLVVITCTCIIWRVLLFVGIVTYFSANILSPFFNKDRQVYVIQEHSMLNKPKRSVNRLLVLCASINDMTAWPFWKFLQMKKIKGVTDMAFLAFNSSGGSFEAVLNGDRYKLKNYYNVKGYKRHMLHDFLHRWHDPGRSYFIYGGHGMGDYLELERQKVGLQIHELADIFGPRKFEAIVFDACFMANLDCAYYLRNNTRYIGASEGYMWEPDSELDQHIFNTYSASVMSRFKDPCHVLRTIGRHYCERCPRGDFAVLDTTYAAELRQFVQTHVIHRVYERATLYNTSQQCFLEELNRRKLAYLYRKFNIVEDDICLGKPLSDRGSSINVDDLKSSSSSIAHDSTPKYTPNALSSSGAIQTRRQKLEQSVHFEHALYPSETNDKHLIDLRSYLVDMAYEEHVHSRESNSVVDPLVCDRAAHHMNSVFDRKVSPTIVGCSSLLHIGSRTSTKNSNSCHQHQVKPHSLSEKGDCPIDTISRVDTTSVRIDSKPATNRECDVITGGSKKRNVYTFTNSVSRACCVSTHGTLPSLPSAPLSPPLPICSHTENSTHEEELCSSHEQKMSTSLPLFPQGSAHHGLDLLNKVVRYHTSPCAKEIYASHLGGLSVTMHEFDRMSRPKEPWPLARHSSFKHKVKHFLKNNSLDEVCLHPVKLSAVNPSGLLEFANKNTSPSVDKNILTTCDVANNSNNNIAISSTVH